MARPKPTPMPPEAAEEVITPLQKLLVGTFLLSIIIAPITAFGLYLAPFYKADGALYRGTYFVLGLAGGVVLSLIIAYVWMAYLPSFLERREERRAQREADDRASKREAERKAREEKADRRASFAGEEE